MSIPKKITSDYNNHLLDDLLRNQLAEAGNFNELKKTYTKRVKKYSNSNTNIFWNNKFENPEMLNEQDEMTKEKIRKVIRYLPKRKLKILDLGIGQGYFEQKLTELNLKHELSGIDISEVSIKRAKKHYKGNFLVGDILDISKFYKNESFDVVVALEVLEHISPKDILSLYKSVYLLLKKGGMFIITTPINEGLMTKETNPSAHLRDYTIPILKAEFELSHFDIQRLNTLFAFPNLYILKKILSFLFPAHWKPNNVQIKAVKK